MTRSKTQECTYVSAVGHQIVGPCEDVEAEAMEPITSHYAVVQRSADPVLLAALLLPHSSSYSCSYCFMQFLCVALTLHYGDTNFALRLSLTASLSRDVRSRPALRLTELSTESVRLQSTWVHPRQLSCPFRRRN